MGFDLENALTRSDGLKVEFGIIYGNESVVIIKAGAGGTHKGHEDKYLRLAQMLHKSEGCTVICLSNYAPDSFDLADVFVIRGLLSEIEGEIKLYYVGASNGATQGLINATKHFDFSRMLLFNLPLMMNFHKTAEALTRIRADIRFIYGEKDPSYFYVPLLESASKKDTCSAKVEIVSVPNADHSFTDMIDTFLDLGNKLLSDQDQ